MKNSTAKSGRYSDGSETKSEGVIYTPRILADVVAAKIGATTKLSNNSDDVVRVPDCALDRGEFFNATLARIDGPVEDYGYETNLVASATARTRLEADHR